MDITEKWADKFGQIWVICGPAYNNSQRPSKWIGDEGEDRVGIPDFFWKIIVRKKNDTITTLALLYPHKEIEKTSKVSGKKYSHSHYLTSINRIEAVTKLNFFTRLSPEEEEALESKVATELWK